MMHLGIILVLFVFSLENGIDGDKLPDHFPQIIERLHDLVIYRTNIQSGYCNCFRNYSSKDNYSSNVETVNTNRTFHVNKTRRNSATKCLHQNLHIHVDLTVLPSSPRKIQFNRKRKRETSVGPAFHAYMTTSETDPGHHHTFIFDRAVTNIGGYYNHHTGIFTSTESAVYVFSWTVFCYHGSYFYSQHIVNSNVEGGIACQHPQSETMDDTNHSWML